MKIHDLTRELQESNGTKIVLLVADGLGGLPLEPGGKTELETARTPNLDALARDGVCGLSIPVCPGSRRAAGRATSACSATIRWNTASAAASSKRSASIRRSARATWPIRGNFCTVDAKGLITDRRAGRPTTERCMAMCRKAAARSA